MGSASYARDLKILTTSIKALKQFSCYMAGEKGPYLKNRSSGFHYIYHI